MSSRFFVLIGLAMLAFPLSASTAMGAGTMASETTPSAAAPAAAPEDGKDAAAMPTRKYSANVCEITGIVAKLESVERSPWSDAPSALSTFETDIWVTVNDRRPHFKNAPADSVCNRGAKGEVAAYKLCSPTKVLKGDRIHATEGLHTGSTRSVGCLFDLVVLPPPEGAKKKT